MPTKITIIVGNAMVVNSKIMITSPIQADELSRVRRLTVFVAMKFSGGVVIEVDHSSSGS